MGHRTKQGLADAGIPSDAQGSVVLQGRSTSGGPVLNEQLNHALSSRIVIEQAKGTVAERDRESVAMEGAFALLRNHARNHNARLADVAGAVIDGSLVAPPSTVPLPPNRTAPAGGHDGCAEGCPAASTISSWGVAEVLSEVPVAAEGVEELAGALAPITMDGVAPMTQDLGAHGEWFACGSGGGALGGEGGAKLGVLGPPASEFGGVVLLTAGARGGGAEQGVGPANGGW